VVVRLAAPLFEYYKANCNQSWHCCRASCHISIPICQHSERFHRPNPSIDITSILPGCVAPGLTNCLLQGYYQPNPTTPAPFTVISALSDPGFATSCAGKSGNCATAWGLRVPNSHDVLVYGAGLYSFFSDYSTSKLPIYFPIYSKDKWSGS
jgi:hypothetical protein